MNPSDIFEDGYALLIGIRYGNWAKPLNGPLNDVDALKKHFEDPLKAAYKPENIIVLSETAATTAGILKALGELASKANGNPNASVMIYYSGHGGNHDHKYFLVPYDFNLNEFQQKGVLDETKAILTAEFADRLNAINAKKCLVLLDCCHAENIPVEKTLANPTNFLNGFVEELDDALENKETAQKGMADGIKKGGGRVILTSCRAEETSLDLGHISLFTKILLESLNGAANIENDGWVRLIDLIRYVPKNVAEEAMKKFNHPQNPMFKRIENLGSEDFIVCAYDSAKVKGAALNHSTPQTTVSHTQLAEILKSIDRGDYSSTFQRLDLLDFENKLQYNRLKREYTAGIKGIDLMDFGDRLKVFLSTSTFN
jgi:hypothetical protein